MPLSVADDLRRWVVVGALDIGKWMLPTVAKFGIHYSLLCGVEAHELFGVVIVDGLVLKLFRNYTKLSKFLKKKI